MMKGDGHLNFPMYDLGYLPVWTQMGPALKGNIFFFRSDQINQTISLKGTSISWENLLQNVDPRIQEENRTSSYKYWREHQFVCCMFILEENVTQKVRLLTFRANFFTTLHDFQQM